MRYLVALALLLLSVLPATGQLTLTESNAPGWGRIGS